MKWSWRIGRIAGIEVRAHLTFVILLLWVGLQYYFARRQWEDAARGVGFICLLFAIIILHELGHALVARRYGVVTGDITLLPIGGVARMDRMPEKPAQELAVALAGPAVNILLAATIYFVMRAADATASLRGVQWVGGSLLNKLLWVNVALALFNLIPAFPMDGGRVLRALLAMRMDALRATEIAATVGQALAFVLGAVGLFYNPFLVFIALFVLIGAEQEAAMVRMKHSLEGIPVERAMVRRFRVLRPEDPLQRAVDYILEGFQEDFPVVSDDKVAGVLTRDRLLAALAKWGPETPVGDVMHTRFEVADPWEMVDSAFARLEEPDCRTIPVLADGRLVGLLTTQNVGELMRIAAALRKRQERGAKG